MQYFQTWQADLAQIIAADALDPNVTMPKEYNTESVYWI